MQRSIFLEAVLETVNVCVPIEAVTYCLGQRNIMSPFRLVVLAQRCLVIGEWLGWRCTGWRITAYIILIVINDGMKAECASHGDHNASNGHITFHAENDAHKRRTTKSWYICCCAHIATGQAMQSVWHRALRVCNMCTLYIYDYRLQYPNNEEVDASKLLLITRDYEDDVAVIMRF